jgi:tetratricopeptide (TPR) repeat protein
MADDTTTLPPDTCEKVKQLCQKGYQDFDTGDTAAALRQFYSAWTLLPKPQNQWQEAGWVLTALGDAYFAKGSFDLGREALLSALHCPKAMGNPTIHLRLGQCLWELNEHDKALSQFNLVIKNGGEALFKKENKKYFEQLANTTSQ